MQWVLKNATELLSHRLKWIAFNISSNNGSLFQMAISLHCMKSQLPFDKTFSMAYVAQAAHKVSNWTLGQKILRIFVGVLSEKWNFRTITYIYPSCISIGRMLHFTLCHQSKWANLKQRHSWVWCDKWPMWEWPTVGNGGKWFSYKQLEYKYPAFFLWFSVDTGNEVVYTVTVQLLFEIFDVFRCEITPFIQLLYCAF